MGHMSTDGRQPRPQLKRDGGTFRSSEPVSRWPCFPQSLTLHGFPWARTPRCFPQSPAPHGLPSSPTTHGFPRSPVPHCFLRPPTTHGFPQSPGPHRSITGPHAERVTCGAQGRLPPFCRVIAPLSPCSFTACPTDSLASVSRQCHSNGRLVDWG